MEINLKTSLLAVALCTGLLSEARAFDRPSEIASSSYWLRLLHYTSNRFGAAHSEIESPEFFLSPDGKLDPLAELNASIAAFQQPASASYGPYGQHPQCAFPERFRFLSERLGLKITALPCPEFEKFKKGVQASTMSIVFAAPYMGNPASMFGHTFLRLNAGETELTSASISYDALPTDDKGLLYALRGLTGGYRGVFSIQPFYSKIKTYSELENRDLWEFRLALSPLQIERLVAHLWELGGSHFDYYFIDENCSYQLLSLLEIANPKWSLVEHFHFATIPLDTIRMLNAESGALGDFRMRRSLYSRFSEQLSELSSVDRKTFDEIRHDAAKFSGNESVATLDALIEWNRYQTENKADGGQGLTPDLADAVLRARSKSRYEADKAASLTEPPQNGHRSSKVSFGGTEENGVGGITFRFRPVLHDLLEEELGYAPYSTLIVGQTDFRYFPSQSKFALDELTIASVVNLQPMTVLRRHPSWFAAIKAGRPSDRRCLDCFGGDLSFGGGASAYLFSDRMLVAALLKMNVEISNAFVARTAHLMRYAPAGELRTLLNFNGGPKVSAVAELGTYVSSFDREAPSFLRYTIEIAQPLKDLRSELRVQYVGISDAQDVRHFVNAAWGFYF